MMPLEWQCCMTDSTAALMLAASASVKCLRSMTTSNSSPPMHASCGDMAQCSTQCERLHAKQLAAHARRLQQRAARTASACVRVAHVAVRPAEALQNALLARPAVPRRPTQQQRPAARQHPPSQ